MQVSYIFSVLLIAALAALAVYYIRAMRPRPMSLEWIAMSNKPGAMHFAIKRHPMTRRDALPLKLLCLLYAGTAFFRLGDTAAPQSFQSFGREEVNRSVTFLLAEETDISKLWYYSGLNSGSYTVEVSADGVTWATAATLEQGGESYFKWREEDFGPDRLVHVKAIRFTGYPHGEWLELGEVALFDGAGARIDMSDAARISLYAVQSTAGIFDEQEVVPARLSWYNSTYFDEIYHARTAYEHIRNVYPYEISHPPLGKLILSLGVSLFGMTPFGWRFMGALFGVLMLPLLYIFIKNIFGKTALAVGGTALFAFDFMHLTQTRIATIDTYTVFFILAAYFFFYRWLTVPVGSPFLHYAIPLALSGLSFGVGAACKWPVLYAGAGLAMLYAVALCFLWRDWPRQKHFPGYGGFLVKTLLLSVLFFVVIPAVIYCASYWPYAKAAGDTSLRGLLKIVADNQIYMFTYHAGVTEPHPYASKWYEWLVNARPILYYREDVAPPVGWLSYLYDRANAFVSLLGDGVLPRQQFTALFASFQNPIVSWTGLLCMVMTAVQMVRRRCGVAFFLLVGFLAQFLPWLAISRPTFAYHYFPSVLFLVLAVCYIMNDLMERRPRGWRWPVYGLPIAATGVYAAFYPVLIGLTMPTWYSRIFLKWLPNWPL